MTPRFHSLDACRAAAMLLGVFFHATMSFQGYDVQWAVRDRSTSPAVDAFVWVCHSFRMPVFFLLGGFFARLLWLKLGPAQFLRRRARRLLVPFIVALIPFTPLFWLLWRWGLSRTVETPSGPTVADLESWRDGASPLHLWFLYYLAMVTAAAAALARWLVPRDWVDALLRGSIRLHLFPLVLAIPLTFLLHAMELPAADTPSTFVPSLRVLVYYGVFFAAGWLLHRQPELLEHLGRRLWIPAILGLVSFAPMGVLVERLVLQGGGSGVRWGADALSAIFGASMVVLFIGAFVRWMSAPRAWVAWLSDASYWSYIVHLPLVVTLQILVARWTAPGPFKYALIMVVTIAACLGSYAGFVRGTFLGKSLNGQK